MSNRKRTRPSTGETLAEGVVRSPWELESEKLQDEVNMLNLSVS